MLGMILIIFKNFPHLFGLCKFKKIQNNLIKCRAINRLPESPKTVISFAFPYKTSVETHNISRYAIVADYHLVIENILEKISSDLKNQFSEYQFPFFVDNSPIPEVKTAALAGLGVIGKNGLLITKQYGSWVFLGEIVTDMPIDCQENEIKTCINCQVCVHKCPGNALGEEKLKINLCASHVSQKKGQLSKSEQDLIKTSSLVWGCDICQEYCPMNKNADNTYIHEFIQTAVPIITKENCYTLKDRAFQWRPLNVIERNLDIYIF